MKATPASQSVIAAWFASHEDNTDFRMLLLRHCKNGLLISGVIGIAATLAYIGSKVYFFDYEIAWQYNFDRVNQVVLLDKVLILFFSVGIIILSRVRIKLGVYRFIFILFALIVGLAILMDDIINRDVKFTSGYLTILLLISSCIPFKPWQMLILSTFMVLMLYLGLLFLPEFIGVNDLLIEPNQIVHLTMIALILVGISTFLYQSRYTTYIARRKAEGFIDSVYNDDAIPDPQSELHHEKKILEKGIYSDGELLVSEISVPSADQVFLNKVKKVIEEHMGDSNFGVEWLAHEVAISPRQLQRRLKASVELSAGSLIRIMRLQRSAQLLEQNAGNVNEIAYKIGFNDPSYFSRIFKKMYGVNPSEYARSEEQ